MEKLSCCIAVFAHYADTQDTFRQLLASGIDKNQISVIGEKSRLGAIAAGSLDDLDDDLINLGVQKANLYSYKSLIYSGAYLVIVSGSYDVVEHVYDQLEHNHKADIAIHFNSL